MQLELDIENLPRHLTLLEARGKQELCTKSQKTAGYGTMKLFTTLRLKEELCKNS